MKKDIQKHEYKQDEKINLTVKFIIKAIPVLDDDKINVKKGTPTSSLNYGEVDVLVSNAATDRYGESIAVEGIDTTEVMRNPVVLWAHDYQDLPLGRILKLWKSGGNLYARIHLDTDLSEFADTVYKMILRGTINAVSIGGLVRKWGADEAGITDWAKIDELEMVELSIVPVGAHPDALVVSKSFGMDVNEFKKQYETFVQKTLAEKFKTLPKDEIKSYIESLKNLISALEASYEATADTEPNKEGYKVRLVLTRSVAKQIDKGSETIIAAINSKFKLINQDEKR